MELTQGVRFDTLELSPEILRTLMGPVDKSKKTAETHSGSSRIINLGIAKDGILPSA